MYQDFFIFLNFVLVKAKFCKFANFFHKNLQSTIQFSANLQREKSFFHYCCPRQTDERELTKTKISAKFLQDYRDVFLSRGQLEQLNQTVLMMSCMRNILIL